MNRLADKRCVVTGASAGIGEAIANALAAEGAAVVGAARRFAAAVANPVAGEVSLVHLDVTDEAAVAELFEALGPIDVLVNNAGTSHFGSFEEVTAAQLRAMLDSHVVGTYLCTRAALPAMKQRRAGHIVTIGSTSVIETFTESAGYTAAKSAQVGLSRVLREELRATGVRVTDVLPGAVDTPIWNDRPGFDRTKMMHPDHVAAAVVDLVARPAPSVDQIVLRPGAGDL